MRDYLKGWETAADVVIPLIERQGFCKKVIIRKPVEAILHQTERKIEEEGRTVFMEHDEGGDESPTIFKSTALKKLFLVRLKTGEKIEMTSSPFVVGKGRDCDYLILGNPTISRRHAKIEKSGEDFFIEDLQSSNHTFIDGEEIEGEYELKDQMIIQLSDEKFKVEIKA